MVIVVVIVVVMHRSKCLFCKLGLNLLKFHAERNALAVAVIWTNGRNCRSVKYYYWARIDILLNVNIEIVKQ